MKLLLLAALWLCAAEDAPKKEDWSSLKTEATAVMGELKYQHGDYSGAGATFRDSLNSSRDQAAPQSHVVGLDLYRAAEIEARRGDAKAAREHLDILLSRYPDSDFAEQGRRLLDMLPKPKGEARADTVVTPSVTKDQPEFLLARIQAEVRARRDARALELCRDFLSRQPGRPEAEEVRLLGAALYLRLGDLEGARRALSFLLERGADESVRAKALHLLAAVELERGRDAEVVKLVPDAAASSDVWLARAQLWRAAAESRLGRRDRAAARLRALVDSGLTGPTRAYALAGLAQDFERRKDLPRSQDALAQAAEQARRWGMTELSASCELAQAQTLNKRQLYAQSAAAYSQFADRYPAHPQRSLALFQAGVALRRTGRREQALAAFAEVADKTPDSVYAYDSRLHLGQLYAEFGAVDKAIAEYEKLGQSKDKRGRRESLLLLAQLHYNAKRFKDALPPYKAFLEENPRDPRRAEVEDLLLTSYWQGDRANPDLLKAAEKYPNHPIVEHIRWELGAQAYKDGDYAKAADWLSRYAADHPKAAHAAAGLFYLGEARLALGDAKAAAAAYRALLERFPKFSEAPQARMRLGGALFASGDYEASARAYAAAAQGPRASDALLDQALAWTKAGRKAPALAAREAWLKRFPKDPRAASVWLPVAEGREAAGKLDAAADAYERAAVDAARLPSLFSAGRLREKLKQTARAARDYRALKLCAPADDPARLRGLIRLGLIEEIADHPLLAMPLYAEVLRLAPRGGADFKTALKRLQALTSDGSLVGARRRVVAR